MRTRRIKLSGLILLLVLLISGCLPTKSTTQVVSQAEEQPAEIVEDKAEIGKPDPLINETTEAEDKKSDQITSTSEAKAPMVSVSQTTKPKNNDPVYTRETFKTPDGLYTIERPLLLYPVGKIQLPLGQSITVRWEGTAKGYYLSLVRPGDGYSRGTETIIEAYLGDVRTYTIPASKFLGGAEYAFNLFATPPLGVERMYPHWTTVRPVNLPGNQATIKVDNDSLRAPTIIYPNENAELPLADLTLKWKFEWNDIRGKPYMELEIEDSDGQRVVLESWVNNEGKSYSFTIPKARLVSGKVYKVKLSLGFDGVTKTTQSSFKIK